MKLRDLFVSIGFDVDDKDLLALDKGLDKTKSILLAVGAAATAAAGMIYGMVKSVADAGDAAAKAAGRMGINIEMLQEYQYVADLAGVSTDALNANMEQFIRRSADAAKGSGEAKDAFKELGISVKDANGRIKGSDVLLGELSDRFAAIEDGSAKVRLAYDLFGRGGIGMINMLNQGSAAMEAQRKEARDLGIVLSAQTALAAEIFGDELLRDKLVLVGIKNQVGSQLLPVLTELLVRFREWVMLNRQVIHGGIDKAVRGAIALLRGLYAIVRGVVVVLGDMVEMLGGIERASRMAAWAIGMFAGAQVLSAIGNLGIGLMALTQAITYMGNAALIANLKLAILPVLIGAGILLLILYIQDLYSYFTGGKSVVGVIIEAFEKKFPRAFAVARFGVGSLIDLIKSLNSFAGGAMDYLLGLFTLDWGRMTRATEKMLHAFDPMIERWKNIISAAAEFIMDKIQPLVDALNVVRGWASSAASLIGEKASGAWNAAQDFFSVGPDNAPVGSSNHVSTRNDVRVNAPVTVTVPEGTPPEQVGRAVQQGVADGLARMLRDAALFTEPEVAY